MWPTPRTLESALKRWLHAGNLEAATCGAFLSGRRPKLARGFWGNPPSYRTHKRVISLPVITPEDLRPTQAIA